MNSVPGVFNALRLLTLLFLAGVAVNVSAQSVPAFATSPDARALQTVDPHSRHIDPLGKLNAKRIAPPQSANPIASAYFAPDRSSGDSLSQKLGSIFATGGNSSAEMIHEDGQREQVLVPAADAPALTGLASAGSLADMESLKGTIAKPYGLQLVNGRHGTPTYIRATDLTPRNESSPSQFRKSQRFLGAIGGVLGLTDPNAELVLHSVSVSETGKTRLRYRQNFRGIPVYAQELSVYIKPTGEITTLRGNFRSTPRVSGTTPNLAAEDARKIVQALHAEPVRFNQTELVILPTEERGDAKLAWRVEAYVGFAEGWHYFIDALSGNVIQQISAIHRGAVVASGTDLTATTRTFTAWQSGSAYYMIDVTRPIDDASTANPLAAPDANGNLVVYDCNSVDLGVTGNKCNGVEQSSSAASGWAPAGVSSLWNVYQTLDYYKTTHQRNSFNGSGGSINIYVNVVNGGGGTPDGAFWSGLDNKMVIGAGGHSFKNLSYGLDVIAHEITHGVIDASAKLTYLGQSGALNESFADFFGAMVDRANWTLGESATLVSPGYLRNMANPHLGVPECDVTQFAQPAHMSEYRNLPNTQAGDSGGVHCNSGIPNRAAFLVAEGLSAEGIGTSIGKEATEKIYYYALTNYLHSNSQFADARKALVDAAVALFGAGSTAESAVKKAWDTVGVVEPTQASTGVRLRTAADSVTGSDYLIYQQSGHIFIQNASGSLGPLNTYPATAVRPAVYFDSTAKTGYVFYANAASGSMRAINLSNFADALITMGNFHAFAISSDGKKMASVNTALDSTIYVTDLTTFSISALPIQPRNSEGGLISAHVIPDSIAFDYSGKTVIFDFAIPQTAPNGATYYHWAIGTINVATGAMETTAGSQPATITLGNPVFASNNNFIVAYDYLDTSTNQSSVLLYDLNRNEATFLANPDLNQQNRGMTGHPVFDGDDTSVVVQSRYTYCSSVCTDYNPYYLFRVPVTKTNGKWEGNPAAAVAISSYFGEFPQWYRAGTRSINAAIAVSSTSVNFGSVELGARTTQSLTISNTGNVDVAVSDLTISGTEFGHDGFAGLIPRGQAVTVALSFQPSGTAGTRSGSLTIVSDATATPPSVGLTGSASSQATTQPPTTTTTTTTTTTAAQTTTTAVTSTTTTTSIPGSSATLSFAPGWNLVGNSSTGSLDLVTALGDTANVTSVWKWIASSAKWAFYAPTLVGQVLADYAAGKGYDILTAIAGGEGFWVNAKTAFTAPVPAGIAIGAAAFQGMASGWNLIAIGDGKTPSQFNRSIGTSAQTQGVVPLNLYTLWAWDTAQSNWYFYAPSLEANGGLLNYIQSKNYLDFGSTVLGPTTGFWVNAATTSTATTTTAASTTTSFAATTTTSFGATTTTTSSTTTTTVPQASAGCNIIVYPANDTGGCHIRLVQPSSCQAITLPFSFEWTTDGSYCETPYTLYVTGDPPLQRYFSWQLSENVSQGITHNGGIARITAADLANAGVTSVSGVYHWDVVGYYGSHPDSQPFKVK